MLRSNETGANLDRSLSPDAGAPRSLELAAIGLAARLLMPGRMHAINGHLHNAVMLADLLGRQAADAATGREAAATLARRIAAVAHEIDALEREIGLWQSLLTFAASPSSGSCDASEVLAGALMILRNESVRLQVKLWTHVVERPVWIASSESGFLRSVIVCATAALQSVNEGATLTLVARDSETEFVVEIAAPTATGIIDDTFEPELLGALVRAAGGRLESGPTLALAFKRSTGPYPLHADA